MKGKIFFIMWNSGSWKWTLIENLKDLKNPNFHFIRSYVTRKIRDWEKNGNIYWFVSTEEFKKSIEKNEFLEYKFVHNLNYYWTKKEDIIDNWIEKWKTVIKEVDIEWLKEIYLNYPELKTYIKSIFLTVDVKTFKKRIKLRQGEIGETELKNRIESLRKENKEAIVFCDYIIDANKKTPEEILKETLEIIKANL